MKHQNVDSSDAEPGHLEQRPAIGAVASPEDLTRWYWTRAELVEIARQNSVSTGGRKSDVVERLMSALSHECAGLDEVRKSTTERARSKRERLTQPFAPGMRVPPGQPMTRELRDWLTARCGRKFRVTQQIRDFMRNPAGGTLADLLVLAQRPQTRREIPEQFELNRFMRVVAAQQPGLSHRERIAAWQEFRQLPSEKRMQFLRGQHSHSG